MRERCGKEIVSLALASRHMMMMQYQPPSTARGSHSQRTSQLRRVSRLPSNPRCIIAMLARVALHQALSRTHRRPHSNTFALRSAPSNVYLSCAIHMTSNDHRRGKRHILHKTNRYFVWHMMLFAGYCLSTRRADSFIYRNYKLVWPDDLVQHLSIEVGDAFHMTELS